jgi:parvulin-like peptidyl-prolyl isomerase
MQLIRKYIKPVLVVIVIAFIVSVFYGLGQYRRTPNNHPQQVGNIIAEVNGSAITYQQWYSAYMNLISRYDSQTLSSISDELLATLKNNVTEQLVNATLLNQFAEKQNISVSTDDVNKEIEQIKSGFNSEQEFNDALKRNNLTLNQLKDNLKSQIKVDKAVQNEYDKIDIPEEEIAKYYEENKSYFFQPEKRKVSHILVEDKEEAELLRNQINEGLIDFEQTAKDKSTCPSAEQGGDLGYIMRGQTVPEFEEVAFSLEIGQLSDVVKTEYGYHILLCNDIQEEKQLILEEASDSIENILTSQKQNEALQSLLTQLREDADIKISYDFTSELEPKEEAKDTEQAEETEIVSDDKEEPAPEKDILDNGAIEEAIEEETE